MTVAAVTVTASATPATGATVAATTDGRAVHGMAFLRRLAFHVRRHRGGAGGGHRPLWRDCPGQATATA